MIFCGCSRPFPLFLHSCFMVYTTMYWLTTRLLDIAGDFLYQRLGSRGKEFFLLGRNADRAGRVCFDCINIDVAFNLLQQKLGHNRDAETAFH